MCIYMYIEYSEVCKKAEILWLENMAFLHSNSYGEVGGRGGGNSVWQRGKGVEAY